MPPRTDPRPGIPYRRPNGDPTRLRIESCGDTDLPVDELPRTESLEAVHPADRGRIREALDSAEIDVVYRIEIGTDPIWIQERGRRVDDGDVIGYLFPACDRVRRQRRLEQQRERLDEFASVVSHDLRNPMSVAVGNLELAREFDGAAADERLDRAMDALDRMDTLISDLLSLAREGRSVETTVEAELRSIVDRAWATVGAPAAAEMVVDEPLPRIECDRDRIQQALENLFRNSIEHGSTSSRSPPDDSMEHGSTGSWRKTGNVSGAHEAGSGEGADGPAVHVFIGPIDDGFYVADDGPGIHPDERDAVFEPGHTTDEDGTGFGLAIVERIVEAHGWSVSIVESRSGGARFELTDVDVLADADEVTARDSTGTGPEGPSAE